MDDLHALGLLLAPLIATALVGRYLQRPSSWARALGKVAVVGLVTLTLACGAAHACGAGQAFAQWLVPGISALVAWVFVGPTALRRGAAVALLALGVVLSLWYDGLVHSSDYVGNPEWVRFGLSEHAAEQVTVRRTWHTWLTGVHEVEGLAAARAVSEPALR